MKVRTVIYRTKEGQECSGKCGRFLPYSNFYEREKKGGWKGWSSKCKECIALSPDKKRDANLRVNYNGFTLAQYNEMLEAQNGLCASCGNEETIINHGRVMPLAVDHCHTTGAIRGLLCSNCNQALGLLYEDPARVEALLKYIHERVLY